MLRRADVQGGPGSKKLLDTIMVYYGSYQFEHVHPLQGGIVRRKVRTTRRPSFPRDNPILFYPKRVWEIASTWGRGVLFYLKLQKIRYKIMRDPLRKQYTDLSLTKTQVDEVEESPEVRETAAGKAVLLPVVGTQSSCETGCESGDCGDVKRAA